MRTEPCANPNPNPNRNPNPEPIPKLETPQCLPPGVVYLREEASGISIAAYYAGKFVSTLPIIVTQPLAFALSFYTMAEPHAPFMWFYW